MLGHNARDRVNGFQGIITGVADYLSGCKQALVEPTTLKDGLPQESRWLDVQRLIIGDAPMVDLDNGNTPGGPSRDAPKR
jgi:hypothetical protein